MPYALCSDGLGLIIQVYCVALKRGSFQGHVGASKAYDVYGKEKRYSELQEKINTREKPSVTQTKSCEKLKFLFLFFYCFRFLKMFFIFLYSYQLVS